MNNGDLIRREALKKRLDEHRCLFIKAWDGAPMPPKDKARLDEIINCIAEVVNSPAVDAVEVVHAKWENAPLCGSDNCRCSNCGSWYNIHANLRGEINYKYCPNCGARMDGNDNV